jgi:hypothetical protein
MWTMAQRERLVLEDRILQHVGLTQFRVYHDRLPDRYDVLGTTHSSAGNPYELWIPIPRGYPDVRPPLYVIQPNPLRAASGWTVNALGVSHQMHTLTPGPGNEVQICHWRDNRWHAAITLDKVLLKGLVWLEAYEQHLATGQPVNSFVTTMKEA